MKQRSGIASVAAVRLRAVGPLALVIVLVFGAARHAHASEPAEPLTSPAAGLSDADADALLAGFNWLDPVAFTILAEAREDPAVVAAAERSIAAGATGDSLWAATYVWVNEGIDAAPLVGLAAAGDPGIRVMAATGLLARGRVEGFEPLFALLTDDSLRPGSPPSAVWLDAVVALARYTAISEFGPPFDASPAQRQAAGARWQAWFAEHRAGLMFDGGLGLWHVA